MYRTLYIAYYVRVLTKIYCLSTITSAYSSYIEDSIDHQFQLIDYRFETAVQRHCNNLKENYRYWTPLKSYKTCFFYIRRLPETTLSCEHAICEKCVITFRSLRGVRKACYKVPQYILYLAKGKTRVRIKLLIAGVRILSIDGGGVRGVVPLEFLSLLQLEVGNEILLETLFD